MKSGSKNKWSPPRIRAVPVQTGTAQDIHARAGIEHSLSPGSGIALEGCKDE